MSIKNSYLSKKVNGQKAYDADMVTAISEKALNSQMRLYLSSPACNWELKAYFLQTMDENGCDVFFMLQKDTDESTIPPVFDLAETVENLRKQNSSIFDELEKLKLFDLESGTSIDNPRLAKAMDYCFGYAFHLVDGIPSEIIEFAVNSGIDIDKVLNIVTLDIDRKSVIFNQFFKEFEVIQLNVQMKRGKFDGRLTKAVQKCSGDNPMNSLWSTQATINVDLRKVKYDEIKNPDVQAKIKALQNVDNLDDVFDISQLLLDLSTLQMISPFTIEGVTPDVNEKVQGYVRDFFYRLENAGQTVYGHSVIPSKKDNPLKVNYLFTPCKQNFDVGGIIERDENGNEKVRNVALYYLMNLEDGHNDGVPSLGNNRDFEWAPLLDDSVSADGVMAISATKFIPLIREKMEPLLPSLIMTKHPYVEAGVYKYKIKWDEPAAPNGLRFTVPSSSPWETQWSYSKEYNQDYQLVWAPPAPFPVASGKICSSFSVDCLGNPGTAVINDIVYPSYNFAFHFKGWLNYGYNSESNSGVYYDHDVLFQVAVKVNANGEIEFIRNVVDTDNKPPKIEIHDWSDFCSAGALRGSMDDLCKGMSDTINKLKGVAVDEFLKGRNSFTGWFMPGAKTFTYKNEGISNYGDLYSYVNYVQENG